MRRPDLGRRRCAAESLRRNPLLAYASTRLWFRPATEVAFTPLRGMSLRRNPLLAYASTRLSRWMSSGSLA
jgi:hypothetical protein